MKTYSLEREEQIRETLDNFEFSQEQLKHLAEVVARYHGQAPAIEQAIGALFLGKLYGWRVVRLLHPTSSWNKFQDILELNFKDWCPETTLISNRSMAFYLTEKLKKFWDVAMGRVKVRNRQMIGEPKEEE